MNTQEAIEFLEEAINIGIPVIQGEKEKFTRVIDLLKRGEKFEEMWGWLDNSVNANGMEYNKLWKKQVGNIIEGIKQKYFPEED